MEAPAARRSSGPSPLTVPRVPTGMNTGVSTTPCGVTSLPRLAAPSVAMSEKLTIRPACRADHRAARNDPLAPPNDRLLACVVASSRRLILDDQTYSVRTAHSAKAVPQG